MAWRQDWIGYLAKVRNGEAMAINLFEFPTNGYFKTKWREQNAKTKLGVPIFYGKLFINIAVVDRPKSSWNEGRTSYDSCNMFL